MDCAPCSACSDAAARAGEKPDPLCACICSPTEPYRSIFNLRAHIKRETENPKNPPGSHAQVTAADLPAAALGHAEPELAAGGADDGEIHVAAAHVDIGPDAVM